jgi:hypothetical protein
VDLALSHPAADIHPEGMAEGQQRMNQGLRVPLTFRTRDDVLRFFEETDLAFAQVAVISRQPCSLNSLIVPRRNGGIWHSLIRNRHSAGGPGGASDGGLREDAR